MNIVFLGVNMELSRAEIEFGAVRPSRLYKAQPGEVPFAANKVSQSVCIFHVVLYAYSRVDVYWDKSRRCVISTLRA